MKKRMSLPRSLGDLNKELTEAQADRINKEAVFQLAQTGNYDAIPAVRESPVIQDILKRQDDLSTQYTDALNQYGPKFPKVVRLQEQLKDLDTLVTTEKKNIGNQIEAEYRGSRQRELLLQQALDQQKTETSSMADKMVQYNILQRDAEANKQLYDGLLQKLKEAGISAGLRSSNIRVVDPAFIPGAPSRPNKSRNISFAVLVGLVGGIGMALLREYLDNTVKNPDDIEKLAHLPSLAVVPSFGSSSNRLALRPSAKNASVSGSGRNRGPRRTGFAPAAAIADFRGVSLASNFAAAVAGRPSAAGHSDDECAAARGQDDGGREPGGDAGATRRQDAAGGRRPPQAGRQPRTQYGRRQVCRVEFLPGGRQYSRSGHRSASRRSATCTRFQPVRCRRIRRICCLRTG